MFSNSALSLLQFKQGTSSQHLGCDPRSSPKAVLQLTPLSFASPGILLKRVCPSCHTNPRQLGRNRVPVLTNPWKQAQRAGNAAKEAHGKRGKAGVTAVLRSSPSQGSDIPLKQRLSWVRGAGNKRWLQTEPATAQQLSGRQRNSQTPQRVPRVTCSTAAPSYCP